MSNPIDDPPPQRYCIHCGKQIYQNFSEWVTSDGRSFCQINGYHVPNHLIICAYCGENLHRDESDDDGDHWYDQDDSLECEFSPTEIHIREVEPNKPQYREHAKRELKSDKKIEHVRPDKPTAHVSGESDEQIVDNYLTYWVL